MNEHQRKVSKQRWDSEEKHKTIGRKGKKFIKLCGLYSISIERNRYATKSCMLNCHTVSQSVSLLFFHSPYICYVQKERLYSHTDTHTLLHIHPKIQMYRCILTRAQLHYKTDHSTEIITIWMVWMMCVWVRATGEWGKIIL